MTSPTRLARRRALVASAHERRAAGARAVMRRDVHEGLSRDQKELPPKYFYDQRGSELFERITELPEYYLTRAERAILAARAVEIVARTAPATLVELGAGSAAKTRLLLQAMLASSERATYAPIDVSAAFLARTAAKLRAEYPRLRVRPVVGDFAEELAVPPELPAPRLVAFLGSTIGNFAPAEAARLLRGVRSVLRPADRLLLGADLRKEVRRLEAAYNDADGVTAEFNRNMLRVINRELGADFDPDAFAHHAPYDTALHRVEMHLVSRDVQVVTVPGAGRFRFRRGESVRTEISCKYDRASLEALLALGGLRLVEWHTDPDGDFALVVATPVA
jgi:L-histidine N-alpha-methyltransferase